MARSFNLVLEELGGEEDEDAQALAEARLKVSANVGFMVMALGPQKKASPAERSSRYEEAPVPEPQPDEPPFRFADLEAEVKKAKSLEELGGLRRRFARSNHPDRCDTVTAAIEMAAANRLVDDAIAALNARAGAD